MDHASLEELTKSYLRLRSDTAGAQRGKRKEKVDRGVSARQKIFEILEKQLLPNIDLQRGRPGMALWRVFVGGIEAGPQLRL